MGLDSKSRECVEKSEACPGLNQHGAADERSLQVSFGSKIGAPLAFAKRMSSIDPVNCLSLPSNAVVIWNTIHMQKIVDRLRDASQTVMQEDLARNWPPLHVHIIPNEMYDFSGR